MPSQGTIFYRTSSNNEREAFEALVHSLGLELDDVRPAPAITREPVRFWIDADKRGRMSSLANYNGVADSTIFRLAFVLGLAQIDAALRAGDPVSGDPMRVTPSAYAEGLGT